MMTLFVKWFVKNRDEVSNPNVKKAYATLSSVVGILLNVFLCAAKITIGLFSNSVAISADGFNNLSDVVVTPSGAYVVVAANLGDKKAVVSAPIGSKYLNITLKPHTLTTFSDAVE